MKNQKTISGQLTITPLLSVVDNTKLLDFINKKSNQKNILNFYYETIVYSEQFIKVITEDWYFDNFLELTNMLIEEFLQPNGYAITGKIEYQGEESNDKGIILFNENILRHKNYEDVMNDTEKYINIVQKLSESDLDKNGYCSNYENIYDLIIESKKLINNV